MNEQYFTLFKYYLYICLQHLKADLLWLALLLGPVSCAFYSFVLYLHEFLVHQDHRKKVLRLRCNENYSGNMKTSNVTQFKQHLKMLSYSVVFIKKRWIYHRCLTKRYSENIQASTTHASCQISELFRTAIPKKRKTTGTAASLLFLLLSSVNLYINIIFS